MDKNKKLLVIVLFTIITTVLYLSFKLNNDEIDRIEKSHFDAIGEVSSLGLKTVQISYTINGSMYTYTMNKPYKNLIVGAVFFKIL